MASLEPAAAERAATALHRVGQVRQLARLQGAEGVLLRARHNIAWLTLGAQLHILLATEASVSAVLVTPSEVVVLAPRQRSRKGV